MLAAARGPLVLCASRRWNEDLPPLPTLGIEEGPLRGVTRGIENIDAREKALLASASGKRLTGDGLDGIELILDARVAIPCNYKMFEFNTESPEESAVPVRARVKSASK
jgi:hypothetical protein